jgi:D-threonate/D-erythronate kinase
MTRLTIVSDDLTGALDATGPLSAPGRPLVVTSDWGGPDLGADLLAVSTETREGVTPAEAARRVARVMAVRRAQAGDAGLWLKKIDSMLRGPWPEEVAASVAAGDFARVVVVPAFPGMGRRTVGGLQEGRRTDGSWAVTGEPIAAALLRVGLPSAPWRPGEAPPKARVVVADALEPVDLDHIARTFPHDASVLWVGSGGIAEALAGHPATLTTTAPDLYLVGTLHEVTRMQVDRLALEHPSARIVDPVRDREDARDAARALDATIAGLMAQAAPGTVLVTGGATLARVMALSGARHLDCIGRISPGLPVSLVRGGAWDGVTLISKSGGLGDPALMVRLAAQERAAAR